MLVEYAAVIAALAAGLAGLLYLARHVVKGIRATMRTVSAVHTIVERELTNGGGTGLKEDVHAVAVVVGEVQGQLDELERRKVLEHGEIRRDLAHAEQRLAERLEEAIDDHGAIRAEIGEVVGQLEKLDEHLTTQDTQQEKGKEDETPTT